VTCKSLRISNARVFVDQVAQDGFSVDPFAVEVSNGEAAVVVLAGCRGGPAGRVFKS
jgi:hypothetical protein